MTATPRGRPPAGLSPDLQEALSTDPTALPPAVRERAETIIDINQRTANAMMAGDLSLAEGVGMVKAFGLIGKFTGMALTKWFAERKERKDYKGAVVIGLDGLPTTLRTFEDLCVVMGFSYEKVNLDLQNLTTFGEQFLEQAQRVGLGYRDLRKLRSLPENDRLMIEGEALDVKDPDSLKDLIEEIASRHEKTKKKLSDKEADLAARDRVLASKNAELDTLKTQLEKLRNPRPEDREEVEIATNAAILYRVTEVSLEFTGAWEKLLSHFNMALRDDAPTDFNTRTQVEMTLEYLMEQIANDLCSRSIHMVDFKRQVIPDWVADLTDKGETK